MMEGLLFFRLEQHRDTGGQRETITGSLTCQARRVHGRRKVRTVDKPRFLTHEELEILLDVRASVDANWEVVVVSKDTRLPLLIRDIFADDPQVNVKHVTNPCDFLVTCTRDLPDIAVVEEGFEDVTWSEVLQYIKNTDGLKEIKMFYSIASEAGHIHWNRDELILKDNLDKTYLARKINSFLYTSSTHQESRPGHRGERRWPRIHLNIDTRIEVIDPDSSVRCDYGEARIDNISREGAFISHIRLKRGQTPEGMYRLRLRVNTPPLEDWKADTMVVRTDSGAAGVKFLDLSREDKSKVMELYD